MLTERSFEAGAVAINYAEGPEAGPPLVVLHGGSARWQYNRALLEDLAARWHVYAPDLRGHGRSGHTHGHYRIADYADDIVGFLRAVVGASAVLYGHSLGGTVAVLVAGRHPALVGSLIVGDAPLSAQAWPSPDDGVHREMLIRWRELAASGQSVDAIAAALRELPIAPAPREPTRRAGDVFGEDAPWFADMAESLHRLDPDTLTPLLGDPGVMFAGYAAATLLPAIRCPALLLQADPAAGGLLSDDEVARALALLPRGSHVRLAGIGHPLRADLVRQAIDTFLVSR